MASRYGTGLFLFRRDLRLEDNAGLARALTLSERVLPAFVFDPRQLSGANEYFSAPAFQFLIESLEDLEDQLRDRGGKLYRFRGRPDEIVGRLIERQGVDAVFVNRDYTPFSRRRDAEIEKVCAGHGVFFDPSSDLLLNEPGTVLTGAGEPYQTFTPFHRRAEKITVAEPRRLGSGDFFRGRIGFSANKTIYRELLAGRNRDLHVHGGRRRALALLARLGDLARYDEERDRPAADGTTGLSAHHKLGTVSIREVYHAMVGALGEDAPPLIRQLYWRDFFTHLAWFNPQVFGEPFHPRYADVEWDDDDERFERWARGKTGFPIVDAGMRQLNETGWMHNRVRMIAGSFLTKDLHLDWRRGERYFARHLVDYDPSVNNGNWQWVASTGADAQPYFRIFNPWRQQQRFDPEGEYVKRWVPELAGIEAADLHRLNERRPEGLDGYPRPMVEHRREAREAEMRFKRAAGG